MRRFLSIKGICFVYFFLLVVFLGYSKECYSQKLENIQIDIENLFSLGLRPVSQGKDFFIRSQGSMESTSSETDFAVSGRGFFALYDIVNSKIILTRNGHFSFDSDGYLINHDNMYVLHSKSNIMTKQFEYIKKDDYQYDPQIKGINLKFYENFEIYDNERRNRKSTFLLLEPVSTNEAEILNSEYLFCSDYVSCDDSSVIIGCLESMPIALDTLIKTTLIVCKKIKSLEMFDYRLRIYFLLKEQYEYFLAQGRINSDYLKDLGVLLDELYLEIYGP